MLGTTEGTELGALLGSLEGTPKLGLAVGPAESSTVGNVLTATVGDPE